MAQTRIFWKFNLNAGGGHIHASIDAVLWKFENGQSEQVEWRRQPLRVEICQLENGGLVVAPDHLNKVYVHGENIIFNGGFLKVYDPGLKGIYFKWKDQIPEFANSLPYNIKEQVIETELRESVKARQQYEEDLRAHIRCTNTLMMEIAGLLNRVTEIDELVTETEEIDVAAEEIDGNTTGINTDLKEIILFLQSRERTCDFLIKCDPFVNEYTKFVKDIIIPALTKSDERFKSQLEHDFGPWDQIDDSVLRNEILLAPYAVELVKAISSVEPIFLGSEEKQKWLDRILSSLMGCTPTVPEYLVVSRTTDVFYRGENIRLEVEFEPETHDPAISDYLKHLLLIFENDKGLEERRRYFDELEKLANDNNGVLSAHHERLKTFLEEIKLNLKETDEQSINTLIKENKKLIQQLILTIDATPLFYYDQGKGNPDETVKRAFGIVSLQDSPYLGLPVAKISNVEFAGEKSYSALGQRMISFYEDKDKLAEEDNLRPYFEMKLDALPLLTKPSPKIEGRDGEYLEHWFTTEPKSFFIGYNKDSKSVFRGSIRRVMFDPNSSCGGCFT